MNELSQTLQQGMVMSLLIAGPVFWLVAAVAFFWKLERLYREFDTPDWFRNVATTFFLVIWVWLSFSGLAFVAHHFNL